MDSMTMTMIKESFHVRQGDMTTAGDASARIKRLLKQLGIPATVVRRVSVGTYEAEINLVIHAYGGRIDFSVEPEKVTIRVVDDVIPALRAALRAKFRRAKNTERSRGAIRAQVVLELENKLAREIITAYDNVAVTADAEDPTRCLVDFSFTVAHGLNQIWLSAHITV